MVPELFSGKEKSWNKAKSYNLAVVVLLFVYNLSSVKVNTRYNKYVLILEVSL